MSTVNEVRATFIDYFAKLGHTPVASSSLVPLNDPTLLFTNAGMVQFKNVFTGLETRPYKRACSSQKCVRVGGKHNDLENVGYTARHHTFFEMLGNFSFGDYFKEFAITHAWDLLTRVYGLDPAHLLVTVYHDDDEAYNLWRKVAGFDDSKIIRIATDDNFWRMADTGPCGPSSEIFYDHGDHIMGGPPGTQDADGDRFVEIWNLVFMQFDQRSPTELLPLPKPSIDTGTGLERLGAVLQGKSDNYDTDLIRGLILASAHASSVEPDGAYRFSHRVIADHLRSSAFLISDGVMPSNEGRGYALRRIMRRAMRHAHILGCQDPMMHRLVPALVDLMGNHFTELVKHQALITETLRLEEVRFKKTLDRGLKLLEEETKNLSADQALPGAVAFKLYDTFGFPLDMTQSALMEKKMTVDVAGFDAAMAEQKRKARESWVGSGDQATETIWFALREKNGPTEFLGYDAETAEGCVIAILDQDGNALSSAKAGDKVALVLNQTTFYGESGGQVGDTGELTNPTTHITVTDTQKKLGALHIHMGIVDKGSVSVGDVFVLTVDHERRLALRASHSCTHLLHAALRAQLGDHVAQKGSMVSPNRVRFDINHARALTAEEIEAVEDEVNKQIRANLPVTTRLMEQAEAVDLGAMALFGEKYGDEVRVVSMGDEAQGAAPYSLELCGGLHVHRTGAIGAFKIISEGALASGVRRLEAVTGQGVLKELRGKDKVLREVCAVLSVKPEDLAERLNTVMADKRKAEREVADLRHHIALGGGGAKALEVVEHHGVSFMARVIENVPPKEMRSLLDDFKKKMGSGIIALAGIHEGAAVLLVGVTKDLTATFNAVALVNVGVALVGGTHGGGRPDMAQAGGPNAAGAKAALDAIEKMVAQGAQAL